MALSCVDLPAPSKTSNTINIVQNYTKNRVPVFYYFCFMKITFPAVMGILNLTPDSFMRDRVPGPQRLSGALNKWSDREQMLWTSGPVLRVGSRQSPGIRRMEKTGTRS